MRVTKAICCALLVALSWPAVSAEKAKTKPKPKPKQEVLTCKLGTEDQQARMAVASLNGKIDSFTYYSKWNARTCSIEFERGGAFSKWSDDGRVTTVSSENGTFVIEQKNDGYHFEFRDVDRERYCGMDGKINGSLTVTKGRDQCVLAGIMEEGTPLGAAHAGQEERAAAAAPATATATVPVPAPAPSVAVAEAVPSPALVPEAPAATAPEARGATGSEAPAAAQSEVPAAAQSEAPAAAPEVPQSVPALVN